MMDSRLPKTKNTQLPTTTGRGATRNQSNRFERIEIESVWDDLLEEDLPSGPQKIKTEYFDDVSSSVVSQNQSPDVPFRYSLNPYRGCAHGCSYCYARPSHEYLGWSAGLDFESKILVKKEQIEPIMLSGVTDPYQPVERIMSITRRCLEAALS